MTTPTAASGPAASGRALSTGVPPLDPEIEELVRPLSARSLVASALIGTHPPSLPGRLLVAMGQRFGISGGTVRVALSRMVERGELVNDDGVYTLAGPLLERQERQDRSRPAPSPDWDHTWEQAVVTTSGRSASDRARLRQALGSLGLGELREGVWLRPANLDPGRLPATRAVADPQVTWLRLTPLDPSAASTLARRLFDLDRWARVAAALEADIGRACHRLGDDPGDPTGDDGRCPVDDALVSGFTLASATLRHLIHDPQLPPELNPPGWPARSLRATYAHFEQTYQGHLRAFFRSID